MIFMVESFKGLSESEIKTLKRRQNLIEKVLNSNKTIDQLLLLNLNQWNKALGVKVGERVKTQKKKLKSLNAQKRLLRQLNTNVKQVTRYHLEKTNVKNIQIQESVKREAHRVLRKRGQYTIVEVQYPFGETRWIKYTNERNYKWQLGKLSEQYGKNYLLIFHDFKLYPPEFTTKEFEGILKVKGIEV